jgi:hypothetical protein
VTLFLGLLFGAVGGIYLAWGRRQHSVPHLLCGFALLLYPIFISNALLIVLIGVVLVMVPIALVKGWMGS